MPEPVTCSLIRSTPELQALESRWAALWDEDTHATPFQSPEWLLPWWHNFSQPDLRVLLILEAETLLAILPFYIYQDPASAERQLLLLGAGTSDYLDGIFSPRCTSAHVTQALRFIAKETDWDIAYLPQLLPHSPLFQALQHAGLPGLASFTSEPCSRRPAVAIQQLPPKMRRNIFYYRDHAAEQGTLELVIANSSDVLEIFAVLERLHTERWQSTGEPGVLADPAVSAWHREALPRLQAKGLLRLFALRFNQDIIAVLYSLIDPPSRRERTQFCYLTGFSTRHAALGAGTILLGLAIEHAAQNGITTIDALRGSEPYKRLWHFEPTPTFGFTIQQDPCSAEAAPKA